MERTSLVTLAEDLLDQARGAHAGRAAATLHPFADGHMRQTVIAMTSGTELGDHESPGEATLQVIRGDVRLTWSGDELELTAGDVVPLPPQRHGLAAVGDAVVLLTVSLSS